MTAPQTQESNLVKHARQELDRALLSDADSDYEGLIATAVLELVEVFARQGHSGGSAAMVTAILERVLRYQPLTPISSDPSEWNEVGEDVWQSRRNPAVFSADGGETWYSIDVQQANIGDRVHDGGALGTLVRCPECGGSGSLHALDNPPEPTTPEDDS